ncbi:MAG TPA: hypothetical protein VF163_19425 [Micromonosporaceae bacterium]
MSDYVSPSNVISRTGAGVVGGLAGGVVLGIILQIMGFMPQFANLVGRDTTGWAWIAQLTFAAVAGAVFGILAGRAISRQLISAGGIGLVYGVLLGAVFILALLPLGSGGELFNLDDRAMRGIGAFALFGIIVGVVYAVAGPRRRYYDGPARRPIFGYITPAARRRRKRGDD